MLKFIKKLLKGEFMKKVKYTSQDVSATLINFANCKGYRITNLQLQKLLYFTQVEYLKETGNFLFEEEFQAWTYGPVQYDVWKFYRLYNRKCITKILIGDIILDSELDKILKNKIEVYFRKNVWKLVEQSHEEAPWKNAVNHNHKIISNTSIESFALGHSNEL